MVLTGNGLTAAHELFPACLRATGPTRRSLKPRISPDFASMQAAMLGVHAVHLRDVRNAWHWCAHSCQH